MEKRKLNYWSAWDFFSQILESEQWDKITLLDFGGSWGNLLRDVNSKIVYSRYYCLDVCKECIENSKLEFPDANWIYYNRWNLQYNPNGIVGESIPFKRKMFDVIIAYSVFTHMSMSETISTVKDELINILNDNGKCVFSFYEISDLEFTLRKYSNLSNESILNLIDESNKFKNGFYLINNSFLNDINNTIDFSTNKMSLCSYYSIDFISKMFAPFNYKIIRLGGNRQNILIITK